MDRLTPKVLETLWFDADDREVALRRIVGERLDLVPPPRRDDAIVATYFFAFRTIKLEDAVAEISYHATSGVKNPPPGSLLDRCSAKPAGVDPWDATGRIGLLHVAFPLEMMRHSDGHLTSCDILHTVAGAIIFDIYENLDSRLLSLQIPEWILRTFPGPAHGPAGVRKLAGFAPDDLAFGTILKPTAGITPDDVGRIVEEVAGCPLLMFIKEDEDLYPDLSYSPVAERTRRALEAIDRVRDQRGGKGILFLPHVTGAPHEIMDHVNAVLEAGASGIMFSETYSGGTVRMVREATKGRAIPPAIYGHNAGIGVKTRGIWREVVDLLARLDGIDFRQTAPVKPGTPFLRPYGQEWVASEEALSRPIDGIAPTMIARAGALDQGNIILNLEDAERKGIIENILFLAGSAINSIKNARGEADPALGTRAMLEALDIHRERKLEGVPAEKHLDSLIEVARSENRDALLTALHQRYPGRVA